jgi:hypothetical protein
LPKEQTFHHNVYVVLMDNAVAKHPSILRLNPKRQPSKPCVYVGMTGIPVDQRFENHRNGYKSAWVVRKYGVRLMPELEADKFWALRPQRPGKIIPMLATA